jgi:hypothetical protein
MTRVDWIPDQTDRRSRILAGVAAMIGTPWAAYLAYQLPEVVRKGVASVAEYVALFGVGWLIYVALIRRALGKTLWKDPHILWWACIGVNAFWILVLLFGVGGPSSAGVAALLSAIGSVVLGATGLRLERRRVRAAQPGVEPDGASARGLTP